MIKKNFGFTLLEVLLVISIVGLLSAGSFVFFTKFSKQQNINIAYDNLRNTLNEAKSSAQSNVVGACGGALEGYQVRFVSPTSYRLEEVCRISGTRDTEIVKNYPLTGGITVSATRNTVLFLVLSGEVEATTCIILTNGTTSQTKIIDITDTGVIEGATGC